MRISDWSSDVCSSDLACGSTYALVPFIDRKSLGGVAGIIGAGGNVGAVAAGFVLKGTGDVQQTFAYLGGFVVLASLCAIAVRFSAEHKSREEALYQAAIAQRRVRSEEKTSVLQ